MKYQIDAISVVEREKPVDVTFLKMILCKEIEKNITVFSILDTKIHNREIALQLLNPFNAVKEFKVVLDKSQRIKEIVNYKEIRKNAEKYYTEQAERMKKGDRPELTELLQEMALQAFQYEETIIRELLKISYFYPFLGGNYRSNSEDNLSLEGFLPTYNIVEKLEKIFFRDTNSTYIKGSIDQSKIYAYSLNEQMKEFGLEYKPEMLSLNSESKIYYKEREINRAESYKQGGIKGYYQKKEKIFIDRI